MDILVNAESAQFTDSAGEEVHRLVSQMRLVPMAAMLYEAKKNGSALPDEVKEHLSILIGVLADLLSVDLPEVFDHPETTLEITSRDINIGRLLKERGYFRFWRFLRTVDEHGIPVFMGMTDPGGTPFSRQEDFIKWFSSAAKVARATLFQHVAVLDRLVTLGFSEEEAFKTLLSKPYAIRETLRDVAQWDKGELVSVHPDSAVYITDRVAPDKSEEIRMLAERSRDDESAAEELKEAMKPVIADLVREVSDHSRAKDALDYVKHDVLQRPEIRYRWKTDLGVSYLEVELVRYAVDDRGEKFQLPPVIVPFIPDVTVLPEEVQADLIKRLPIVNRDMLDF